MAHRTICVSRFFALLALFAYQHLAAEPTSSTMDYWSFRNCCHIPDFNFSSYARQCPKVLDSAYRWDPKLHRCIYKANDLLESRQRISMKNMHNVLVNMLNDDTKFVKAYESGFMKCFQSNRSESVHARAAALRVLKSKTNYADLTAISFSLCADLEVFKQCPESAWTDTSDCNNHKQQLKKHIQHHADKAL